MPCHLWIMSCCPTGIARPHVNYVMLSYRYCPTTSKLCNVVLQVWPGRTAYPDYTNASVVDWYEKYVRFYRKNESIQVDALWIVSTITVCLTIRLPVHYPCFVGLSVFWYIRWSVKLFGWPFILSTLAVSVNNRRGIIDADLWDRSRSNEDWCFCVELSSVCAVRFALWVIGSSSSGVFSGYTGFLPSFIG